MWWLRLAHLLLTAVDGGGGNPSDVPLSGAMLVRVQKKATENAATTPTHDAQFAGGDLRAKPDVAVFVNKLVVALGETKVTLTADEPDRCVQLARRPSPTVHVCSPWLCLLVDVVDRDKLACMSAALSGALQLRICLKHQSMRRRAVDNGNCHCGDPESLFPIPLIESYQNVIRLYYGKTLHDRIGA